MKPLALFLAALWACQDPAPPRLVVGETTEKSWTVTGSASIEDDSELRIGARRLERLWDVNRKGFIETKTDKSFLRTVAIAKGRSFSGSLKAGPPGRYAISLSTDEKEILSDVFAFGKVDALFAREPESVKALLESADKARELLDEVEKILRRQADVSEQTRDAFVQRVNRGIEALDNAYRTSDLTGSIHLVRKAYFHLQGVKIFDDKNPPAANKNDPAGQGGVFNDKDVTLDVLRKLLATLPEVISLEIKVSTTLLMERLLAQASDVERLLETARTIARAGSKYAETAPDPDKELIRLLDLAADRQTALAEIREQLKQFGNSLLLK